jgi:hypothetical protein
MFRRRYQPTPLADIPYDEVLLQSYQGYDPSDPDGPRINERFVTRLVSHGVLTEILGSRPEWPNRQADFTDDELGQMCFDAVYHSVMMGMRRIETRTTFDATTDEDGGERIDTRRWLGMGDPNRELTDEELSQAADKIDDFNPNVRPVNFGITLRVPNPTDPENTFWNPVVQRRLGPEIPEEPSL